jgi:thymidine kinase
VLGFLRSFLKGSVLKKTPQLIVIAGCMASGKSLELMRYIRRLKIAGRKFIPVKPSIDTRDFAKIRSRDGLEEQAYDFRDPQRLLRLCNGSEVIIVDEAQFLGPEYLDPINGLLAEGRTVIAAGLDTDFRGQPFGIMPQLMALSDVCHKLTAICKVCGNDATRTQRLINGFPAPYDAPIIQVGGDETYEARCRDHHELGYGPTRLPG